MDTTIANTSIGEESDVHLVRYCLIRAEDSVGDLKFRELAFLALDLKGLTGLDVVLLFLLILIPQQEQQENE